MLVTFEFKLDALNIDKNISVVQGVRRAAETFEVYPDPQLFDFATSSTPNGNVDERDSRVQHYSDYLVVQVSQISTKKFRISQNYRFCSKGKNLNRVVTEQDVKVVVGGKLRCNISTWHDQAMACKMPSKQKLAQQMSNAAAAMSTRVGDSSSTSSKLSLPEVIVVVGENSLNYSLGRYLFIILCKIHTQVWQDIWTTKILCN